MKAMVIDEIGPVSEGRKPLVLRTLPDPKPKPNEVLLEVLACGVCHTELDEIEGRTPPAQLPMIPGHEVIGRVIGQGDDATRFEKGERVGVAWIFWADGECEFCQRGEENLCESFMATGRDANGGYAEKMTVSEEFAYRIPEIFTDVEAAPLLCAGAVGYRSLRLTQLENGQRLGLTGFGASGHLVLQMAKHKFPESEIYVFARNPDEREFARELGAVWTGPTEAEAPEPLHAIIDTTPAWKPVVESLKNLIAGGRLVINAIRKEAGDKEELLNLDYSTHLWMEREIKSVANVTRSNVEACLSLAAEIPLKPETQTFDLEEANRALIELRTGRIRGAKVLKF
jgi:alcohol dehydrogenase, propanol-preferring